MHLEYTNPPQLGYQVCLVNADVMSGNFPLDDRVFKGESPQALHNLDELGRHFLNELGLVGIVVGGKRRDLNDVRGRNMTGNNHWRHYDAYVLPMCFLGEREEEGMLNLAFKWRDEMHEDPNVVYATWTLTTELAVGVVLLDDWSGAHVGEAQMHSMRATTDNLALGWYSRIRRKTVHVLTVEMVVPLEEVDTYEAKKAVGQMLSRLVAELRIIMEKSGAPLDIKRMRMRSDRFQGMDQMLFMPEYGYVNPRNRPWERELSFDSRTDMFELCSNNIHDPDYSDWFVRSEANRVRRMLEKCEALARQMFGRKIGTAGSWRHAIQNQRHYQPYFDEAGTVYLTNDTVLEPVMLGSGVSHVEVRCELIQRDREPFPILRRSSVVMKQKDIQMEVDLCRHYFNVLRVSIMKVELLMGAVPRNWERSAQTATSAEDTYWMYGEFGALEGYVHHMSTDLSGFVAIPPDVWWNNSYSRDLKVKAMLPLVLCPEEAVMIRVEMLHLPRGKKTELKPYHQVRVCGVVFNQEHIGQGLQDLIAHMNGSAMKLHLENEIFDMFEFGGMTGWEKMKPICMALESMTEEEKVVDRRLNFDWTWKTYDTKGVHKKMKVVFEEKNKMRKRKREEQYKDKYYLAKRRQRLSERAFGRDYYNRDPLEVYPTGVRSTGRHTHVPLVVHQTYFVDDGDSDVDMEEMKQGVVALEGATRRRGQVVTVMSTEATAVALNEEVMAEAESESDEEEDDEAVYDIPAGVVFDVDENEEEEEEEFMEHEDPALGDLYSAPQ